MSLTSKRFHNIFPAMTSLRQIFAKAKNALLTGWVVPEPMEDNDEAKFGWVVNQIARVTNHIPQVINDELERIAALTQIDIRDPRNVVELLDKYCERHDLKPGLYVLTKPPEYHPPGV